MCPKYVGVQNFVPRSLTGGQLGDKNTVIISKQEKIWLLKQPILPLFKWFFVSILVLFKLQLIDNQLVKLIAVALLHSY